MIIALTHERFARFNISETGEPLDERAWMFHNRPTWRQRFYDKWNHRIGPVATFIWATAGQIFTPIEVLGRRSGVGPIVIGFIIAIVFTTFYIVFGMDLPNNRLAEVIDPRTSELMGGISYGLKDGEN